MLSGMTAFSCPVYAVKGGLCPAALSASSTFIILSAAVWCVVFFHCCEPPFMGGFFQAAQAAKSGLEVATPTKFPQDKISD